MKTYKRKWVKEKNQMVLVLITVTMMFQFQMQGCVGCLETERIGLLQLKSYLKNVFNDEGESILKSWSHDAYRSDCCEWERVECSDAVGGHVVTLSLDELMPYELLLQPSPPRSLNLSLLHSFPQLQNLNFSANWFRHLFDPIHGYKSFQRLEKLRVLHMSYNGLNNSVLPFLSAARSLGTLNLGGNSLKGVFPPKELSNMTELRVLEFYENRFNSFCIQGLINFRELEVLDLRDNSIRDIEAVPGYKSLQSLEKLRTLNLSSNKLNNSVLLVLSVARSLKTLDMSNNNLEGVFPPNELANMTELGELDLQMNAFRSFSVQGLINLRELEVLNLGSNFINDVEAGDGLRTTKLKTLDLRYNNFSKDARLIGLEYLVELKVLRLAGCIFNHTGSIRVVKDMPKLQELDLSSNAFTDLDSLGLLFPSSLQMLNLRSNHLSPTPKGYSEICRLMNLRELDFSNNALTSMPNCLGNLTRLRTLELSDNQLIGNLSSAVFSLPLALEYLSLLDNNFSSPFLFKSLVNHTRLKVFKMSSKVGMIQAQAENSWVPLFQLKMLILRNVSLSGTIPCFLLHQHDLRVIDLSHNQLTGAFPTWLLQNNTKLQTIFMKSNSLTEFQLPRLVHGLRSLDISANRIYDSIQDDLGTVFPNLTYMIVSSNHFHGSIPSSMGEMKSLKYLDMSSNGLNGQLPKTFLSSCYSLKLLKLSNNQFEGKIFHEHANLPNLVWLFLDGNNFNGSLGKGLLNSYNLYFFDISDNNICGRLPLWIGRLSGLSYLNMRGNQLKGHFPRQLQNLQQLSVIDMSNNSFSGTIPRNFDFPFLTELRLQRNEFMGSIPDTLFKIENLELLDLRYNNFSGKILNTIGKKSNLRVLLLRNNNLQGQIPEKIGQVMSEVGLLDLSQNIFEGAIPSSLANMSFGAERYYDDDTDTFDKLFSSGGLYLEDWKYTSALNLDYLDDELGDHSWTLPSIVEFFTKNRYEPYQGNIISFMYGLDLSSNQLSGEIPIEIGKLKNIKSLNFSSNRLTGSIPDSFSKLKDLGSLDLSNNKLDGIIPPQLAELNSLGYFDVSFNNLSGEIPVKGHLLTFDEKSYIGNAYLCGLPTNKSCNPASVPSNEEEEEKEGDGVIDMEWFYWTCGAVYISTSLALFVFLRIDSRWSQEWFYRVNLCIHHLQSFKRRFVCN